MSSAKITRKFCFLAAAPNAAAPAALAAIRRKFLRSIMQSSCPIVPSIKIAASLRGNGRTSAFGIRWSYWRLQEMHVRATLVVREGRLLLAAGTQDVQRPQNRHLLSGSDRAF